MSRDAASLAFAHFPCGQRQPPCRGSKVSGRRVQSPSEPSSSETKTGSVAAPGRGLIITKSNWKTASEKSRSSFVAKHCGLNLFIGVLVCVSVSVRQKCITFSLFSYNIVVYVVYVVSVNLGLGLSR